MTLELTVVDAFTDQPFTGNPAAVTVVDAFPQVARMQAVSTEINLSATAFVVPRPDGDHDLRWFSPSVEIDLCGHATLAAAHVLGGPARFHTRSGLLTCTGDGTGLIEMDFPADPPVADDIPPGLSIGGVRWFGKGRFDVLIEVENADAVRGYRPDLTMIAGLGSRAVIVTAPGDQPGIDCVSRVFGPNAGIPEDPVTGSAHCTLAAHWGGRLGKDDLVGRQVSPRGGTVVMHREGDRVRIGGSCVTMAEVLMATSLVRADE
jgi:predicted PhzF superfamily epimerase YddE/YHI9